MKIANKVRPFPILLTVVFLSQLGFIEAKSNSPVNQQDTTVILSTSINGVHSFKATDGISTYTFKYKGKIKVADDDRSIESISSGGYLMIKKTTFGNTRSIIIENDSRGDISYEYLEGRKEIPFEPEGKKWLEDVLLDVIRMTGIDAEGRAGRIYAKNGTKGVLYEIDEIRSNHVKGIYFKVLLAKGELSDEELINIALEIANSISSNSERGSIYRQFGDRFLVNDNVASAYFKGISKLSSNSERGSILRRAVKRHELSDQQIVQLLYVASKMSSNSEKGSVLRSIDYLNFDNPGMTESYFGTISTISSSSETGSVLRHLINNQDLEDEELIVLFENLKKVSSSSEKGSVLRTMDDIRLTNKEVILGYFGVVNTISSSSEKGHVLRNLLNTRSQNKASLIAIFITAKNINSNSEKGSVLRTSIQWLGEQDEKVMGAFFNALNTIESSAEHGSVLRHLIDAMDPEVSTQLNIIKSTVLISSNSEKASVLVKLADKADLDNETVKEAFVSAARTITSDSEFRRVMMKVL